MLVTLCYTCNTQNLTRGLKREIWSVDLGNKIISSLILLEENWFFFGLLRSFTHCPAPDYFCVSLDLNSTIELLLIYFGVLPDWCLLPCMDWLLLCWPFFRLFWPLSWVFENSMNSFFKSALWSCSDLWWRPEAAERRCRDCGGMTGAWSFAWVAVSDSLSMVVRSTPLNWLTFAFSLRFSS